MARASKAFLDQTRDLFHFYMADKEKIGEIVDDTSSGKIIWQCRERLFGKHMREEMKLLTSGEMAGFDICAILEGEVSVAPCFRSIELVAVRASRPRSVLTDPSGSYELGIITRMTHGIDAVARIWSSLRLAAIREVIALYGHPCEENFPIRQVAQVMRPIGANKIVDVMFASFTEHDVIRIMRAVPNIVHFSKRVEELCLSGTTEGRKAMIDLVAKEARESNVIFAPAITGIRTPDVWDEILRAAATLICYVHDVENHLRRAFSRRPDSEFEQFIVDEASELAIPDIARHSFVEGFGGDPENDTVVPIAAHRSPKA